MNRTSIKSVQGARVGFFMMPVIPALCVCKVEHSMKRETEAPYGVPQDMVEEQQVQLVLN